MVYKLNDAYFGFPDPEEADSDGVIAVGGDLSPRWLLESYCSGIFPWFEDDEFGPVWFSPDPRMVLKVKDFRPHKSLRRVYRSGKFEVRVDTCFSQIVRACGSTPRNYEPAGSWVNEHFIRGYTQLYDKGYAHSFETFLEGRLVGGLYGLSIADWFFGESMFHTETDASKVAFCAMVDFCRIHGLRWVDCQMETPHLASLGARTMPRKDYLELIYNMPQERTLLHRWSPHSVALLLGSNEDDRTLSLDMAAMYIENLVGHIACESSCYETQPWGTFAEENPRLFLNKALIVDTELSPHEVLVSVLMIEDLMGRQRNPEAQGYLSRPIDIDLIFYDNLVVDTKELILPHPRAHLRRFVLEPLAELMPDYIHPTLGQTVEEMLQKV